MITQKPHALFVNQYFPPDEAATAQTLGDLVEAARRENFECRIVTSEGDYVDPEVRYPRRETWRGASVERVRATDFGRGSNVWRALDYATFLANTSGLPTCEAVLAGTPSLYLECRGQESVLEGIGVVSLARSSESAARNAGRLLLAAAKVVAGSTLAKVLTDGCGWVLGGGEAKLCRECWST